MSDVFNPEKLNLAYVKLMDILKEDKNNEKEEDT